MCNNRIIVFIAADIQPSDILLNKNGDIKCDLDLLLHRIENKYKGSPPTIQRTNTYVPVSYDSIHSAGLEQDNSLG